MDVCPLCNRNRMVVELGSLVCTNCGNENFSNVFTTDEAYTPYSVPISAPASYTRVKRFRKYLQRAAMNQSSSTIPRDTWDYLLKGQPYRGPGNIVRRLKKAPKNVRKKCYDSLPMLVRLLCPHLKVPTISEREKSNAMAAFSILDLAYREGEHFVSYLYVLEYILALTGRSDVLPYINKISCKKRRAAYRRRLDLVFRNTRYRRA